MKKILGILAIAGSLVACNSGADSTTTTDTTKVNTMNTTSVDSTKMNDTTHVMTDTSHKMGVDSTKK